MITPGLLRRSFASAAQWRLVLLAPLLLLVPAAVAMIPIARFLGEQLDHQPRWKELVPRLDSQALFALVKQLGTPGAAGLPSGFLTSVLVALVLTPLIAGAALAAARSDEELDLRELLRGAAEHYGRLLRMQVASLLPLGAFFGAVAGLTVWQTKLVERSLTEAQALRNGRLILAAIALLGFLANLVLDAGRAWFAAQPSRRSAFFALGAGVKLVVRRPLQSLTIGLVTAAALLLPAAVMVLRQRVTQGSGGTVALAFLLAQLAVALVAYGHAARLIGLTELARADLADRARKPEFEMAPPRTSPPPPESPLSPLAAISPVSNVPVLQPSPAERGPSIAEFGAPPADHPALVAAAEFGAAPTRPELPAMAAAPSPREWSAQVEQEAALGPVGIAPDFGAGPGNGTGGGA